MEIKDFINGEEFKSPKKDVTNDEVFLCRLQEYFYEKGIHTVGDIIGDAAEEICN